MNNTCEWRKTHIFPDEYLVSDKGDVKSVRSGKILRPTTDKDGYAYYVLCVNGCRKTVKAHRLVAEAFIENVDKKPSIDHINGIKTDNRASNLRWVTNKENTNNPITLEKVIKAGMSRLPKMQEMSALRGYGRKKTAVYKGHELVGVFKSQASAAQYANVSIGKVSMCVNGKKKSCKGFVFVECE